MYRYRPPREQAQSTFGGFNIKLARPAGNAWIYDTILDLDLGNVSTSAALGGIVRNGKPRIYFVIEKQEGNFTTAQLVLATEDESGGWRYYKVGNQAPRAPMRFQVIASGTRDLLYVTEPNSGALYELTVTELESLPVFDSAQALINSL